MIAAQARRSTGRLKLQPDSPSSSSGAPFFWRKAMSMPFLRARPKDRAALLDKITNTGVYAEISRRVHELCRVAEASIERLAAELGGIGLMPPERRSGLEAERREAEQALISHKQERDRIDGEIVRHGQIEACRAALVRAESDLAEAVRQAKRRGRAEGASRSPRQGGGAAADAAPSRGGAGRDRQMPPGPYERQ